MTDQLKRLSRRAGVTLFTTTLAGYAALLYRYSGCTDVVVGGPAANRSHWKLEPLIGSTLNILAYRFDLTGNPDVLTLLARVRATVVAALTHQDVPFASIAPMLEPDRQRTGPLFRTALTFSEETPHHQLDLPGMKVTFLEKFTNREIRPELFPVIWEDRIAGTLTSYWLYREDMFSAVTMAQMVADYEALLIAMIDDPTRKIDTLVSSRSAPRT
jgi:non-ribosomal peptide synthetase component F